MGKKLTNIILGIGLNVEQKPDIAPSPSVPLATSLWENIESHDKCKQSEVLGNLLEHLQENYKYLCEGKGHRIIDFYRSRSMIINKEIMVYDDAKSDEPVISRGVVERIGNDLELYLVNQNKPITKGRLVLL
jgi:biotin-(acetyl-CoA carboxylase) ligase